MEQNTDRMWWTIGSVVLGGILIAGAILLLKTTVLPNIKTKIDDLDRSAITNKQDVTHTAYAWSEDGTDRFTTTKPNLNLFTGTSYKPSTSTGSSWNIKHIGAYKAPKVGQEYTFSVEVPESDHDVLVEVWRCNDDKWGRINTLSTTVIKPGGKAHITFTWPEPGNSGATQIVANLAWTNDRDTGTYSYRKAKLEEGSTATPYMPSASEVKPSDQPKYIGTYTDKSKTDSQDPNKYTWKLNPDYHE